MSTNEERKVYKRNKKIMMIRRTHLEWSRGNQARICHHLKAQLRKHLRSHILFKSIQGKCIRSPTHSLTSIWRWAGQLEHREKRTQAMRALLLLCYRAGFSSLKLLMRIISVIAEANLLNCMTRKMKPLLKIQSLNLLEELLEKWLPLEEQNLLLRILLKSWKEREHLQGALEIYRRWLMDSQSLKYLELELLIHRRTWPNQDGLRIRKIKMSGRLPSKVRGI